MGISLYGFMGWKCLDYKFQILSHIDFGTVYLIKLTHLENVILLFALQLPDSLSGIRASLYL